MDSHFFDERGVGVGEDVALLPPQRAARHVEVDPQVGVVSLYRHTDVLETTAEGTDVKRGPDDRVGGEEAPALP